MKDASRPVSLGLFVLILFSFLLPFTGTYYDKRVDVETGYQVAFEPDVVAIACLVAALVGVGLVMVKGRRGAVVRAIYSGHCILLPLAFEGERELRNFGAMFFGGGDLRMLAGLWVTLALFGAACVVNLIAIRHLPRAPAPPVEAGTGVGPDDS